MKRVPKSEFKAKMLEIMRQIEATGEQVIITDHGRPCIEVRPYARKRDVREVFGDLSGRLVLHEDPDQPTLDEWSDA